MRKPKSDVENKPNETVLSNENEHESTFDKTNTEDENKVDTNRAHLKRNAAIIGELRRKYNDSDL